MNVISVEDLIAAGAHFGHPTSRWHPSFNDYISMKKNGVHIIDMEQTSQCMLRAAQAMEKIVKKEGNILFVGTKKQAKDVVQLAADRCGMYYIVERWLGGTLTNYGTIKKSIKRLTTLEKESSSIYANLTKKELNSLERERIRLADLHRGIKDMKHLPSALFFVDGIHEKIAIAEAKVLGIPTFGIVDSNTDPSNIEYPIPANDDSMKTINLIVNYFADMIINVSGKNLDSVSLNDNTSEKNNEENKNDDNKIHNSNQNSKIVNEVVNDHSENKNDIQDESHEKNEK